MDGIGLLVVVAFLILIIAIVTYTSCDNCQKGKEGFNAQTDLEQWDSTASKPQTRMPTQPEVNVPTVGPAASSLIEGGILPGCASITDLPSAPVNSLGETNSLPYQDPALEKATRPMMNQLKKDMDGFSAFEVPYLQDKSDPAVKLPLIRFQGDYQRIKDELSVITRNPGLQTQLTIEDVNNMGANLRFLQRTYRIYADNKMVPKDPKDQMVPEPSKEGFDNPPSSSLNITPDQLQLLSEKLAVEIVRLQASGTNDPVTQARVNVFTQIKQSVDSMITSIKNGTMDPTTIPIKLADYNKFLPALGDNSAGISGLLSKSGYPTLSSLFNAYDAGDISGSNIAAHMFETYADSLLNGLSYKVDVSYTSPNEVALRQAEASAASSLAAMGAGSPSITYSSYSPGLNATQSLSTNHPLTMFGSRGSFDAQVRQMDVANMVGGNPASVSEPAKFDWKNLSQTIARRIRSMGLNPDDYGVITDSTSVGQNFSWRGYTKMVCSRLATNVDPGVPEQCGCPPVSWKGWSS
uniref:Uncharacterized protein n=1 Tax=viral metagenome TaxID=1070528 RepID=A0A6C0KJL8_9ZZZZ